MGDIEGYKKYSFVHSKPDYREGNVNFDAIKKLLNQSKLFYLFYKEYKEYEKHGKNKLCIGNNTFWVSLEYVMYLYLWTHYQNWYKHAQFLKSAKAKECIDVSQSISYHLSPVLVEEIDDELQLYFFEEK